MTDATAPMVPAPLRRAESSLDYTVCFFLLRLAMKFSQVIGLNDVKNIWYMNSTSMDMLDTMTSWVQM